MITATRHPADQVKITVICDNTAVAAGTLGEHGLAVLVETPAGRLLLDTGAGHSLLHNAEALGIDLCTVDAIAISHGHQDHSGGLAELLAARGSAAIHAHPAVFSDRYSVREGHEPRPNGMQHGREEYERLGAAWHLAEGPQEVMPGVWLSGEIARTTDFEWQDEGFRIKGPGEQFALDKIPDDQALVVSTDEGLIIIAGCAHSGPVAMVRQVREQAPGRPVMALMGGLHLYRSGDERLALTARALRFLDVRAAWAGHCTGFRAQMALAREYPGSFAPLGTGMVFPERR